MSTEMFLLLATLVNVMCLWASAACAPLQPRAIPLPTPTQSTTEAAVTKNSFQDFSKIHLTTTPWRQHVTPALAQSSLQSPADTPIGFHIQLGHNVTIPTSREVQLGNYSLLKQGLFATGPASFEAYSGTFWPPVTGYYQLAAIVHLTLSSVVEQEGIVEATVSLCLAGRCHGANTASLEAVTTTQGRQTINLSGILYLTAGGSDAVILCVTTTNVSTATVWRQSSVMAFLLGRIGSI